VPLVLLVSKLGTNNVLAIRNTCEVQTIAFWTLIGLVASSWAKLALVFSFWVGLVLIVSSWVQGKQLQLPCSFHLTCVFML